jgi:glycerol uptake facilitator-like aquaporin
MSLQDFRERFGTAFSEFIGTFILVLTIQLAVASGSSSAPLAIGLVLVAIVYACGPISGAHVNPAVVRSSDRDCYAG